MFKSYARYIAALLLFGSNGLVSSFITLGSTDIVFLRSTIGAAALLIIFFASGRRFTAWHHGKELLFIALSGFAMGLEWILLFEAYARIGVSLGILINYTGPAIVMALSPVLFKERLHAAGLASLFAALIGVFLISGSDIFSGKNTIGLICAAASAVGYAAMVLFIKKIRHTDAAESAVLQLFFAAVFVTVVKAAGSGLAVSFSASEFTAVLWLGLINTGLGCFLYFSSMHNIPAQSVAVLGYIEPLSGVLLSALFLNERLTLLQTAGAVLILGGAVFSELSKRKAPAS